MPLTGGFAICVFLLIRHFECPEERRFNGFVLAAICGAILWACGLLALAAGLGVPPALGPLRHHGHPAVTLLLSALEAYYHSYGWPLMACALAIGASAAFQADRWFRKLRALTG